MVQSSSIGNTPSGLWSLTPVRILLHLAFAVLLQFAVLQYLSAIEWIQPVMPWDDVAFTERGIRNYDRWARGTFASPRIHAPLGDLQTLLGLALFQLDVRGPYVLNVVYIGALTLFIDYYLRAQALRVRIFATGIVLTFMPFLQGLAQLKSDCKGGLFLCMGLLLLFEPQSEPLGRLRRLFATAACFLLALSAKMTAIYLPAVVLGAIALHAIGYSALGRRGRDSSAREVAHGTRARIAARYLLLVGLIALGYAVMIRAQWTDLLNYVKFALSDKWDEDAVGLDRWLFYTPLGGSGRYWRGHFILAVAICALAWRRARWSGPERIGIASIGIVLAVLYVPLLVDRNLNPDFGAFAYFTVIAGLLFALRVLARHWQASLQWPVIAAVWIVLLLMHDVPLKHIIRDRRVPNAESALTDLVDAIHARGAGDQVEFLFDNLLLPHPNVAIQYYRRYGSLLSVDRVDDFDLIQSKLLDADYALAIDDPGAKGLVSGQSWTSNRRIPEVLQVLDHSPAWDLIATIPYLDFHLRLYARHVGDGE